MTGTPPNISWSSHGHLVTINYMTQTQQDLSLDFFTGFKLKTAMEEEDKSIPLPEITYPDKLWADLSPAESAIKFVKYDFEDNLEVFTSKFTTSISPAAIAHNNGGKEVLLVSLTADIRAALNSAGKKIYSHKLKRGHSDAKLVDEIVRTYSEYGLCLIINSFASICGFKKRLAPDFNNYLVRDLSDIKIGSKTFDAKHRDSSYNEGWFTDVDYMTKGDYKNTVFLYTTGRQKWTLDKIKNTNMSYELALVGSFDKQIFDKHSQIKAEGKRRVLDPVFMSDLKDTFTLFAMELSREEGYLK